MFLRAHREICTVLFVSLVSDSHLFGSCLAREVQEYWMMTSCETCPCIRQSLECLFRPRSTENWIALESTSSSVSYSVLARQRIHALRQFTEALRRFTHFLRAGGPRASLRSPLSLPVSGLSAAGEIAAGVHGNIRLGSYTLWIARFSTVTRSTTASCAHLLCW